MTNTVYRDRQWARLAILLLAAAVAITNLFKPFHIDDTLYLRITEQIMRNPLNPYAGAINWQHIPQRTYDVSISPPFLSYYLACFGWIFGVDAWSMHTAMAVWPLLLAGGMLRLVRTLEVGLQPAWLVVACPAVVVSLNLMLDVPLTAALVWAVICLEAGVSSRRLLPLLAAGLWGSAAVLIKYPGGVFLLICLAYTVSRRRWTPIIPFCMVLAALLCWLAWSRHLYGAGQLQQASGFLQRFQGEAFWTFVERLIQSSAVVAMTIPIWIISLWSGRSRRIAAAVAGLALAAALWSPIAWPTFAPFGVVFISAAGLGVFGLVETGLSAIRFSEGESRRWLLPLLVWLFGVLVLTVVSAPFIAVRYFLPLLPAWALLAAIGNPGAAMRSLGWRIATSATVILSIGLAAVDFRWAEIYRRTASEFGSRYAGRPAYFAGHWGWQYYMEAVGALPWDARVVRPIPGFLLVIPLRADTTPIHPAVADRLRLIEEWVYPAAPLGATVWRPVDLGGNGVRFYGGGFPHLPWWFLWDETERIGVYEIMP